MIVTSYTRLVMESHRTDCIGMLDGLSNRFFRRDAARSTAESYPDWETVPVRLDTSGPRTAEVASFVNVASGKIRGAA